MLVLVNYRENVGNKATHCGDIVQQQTLIIVQKLKFSKNVTTSRKHNRESY